VIFEKLKIMKKVLLLYIFAIFCSQTHSQIPPDEGLQKILCKNADFPSHFKNFLFSEANYEDSNELIIPSEAQNCNGEK
jgi:hypothetical protein